MYARMREGATPVLNDVSVTVPDGSTEVSPMVSAPVLKPRIVPLRRTIQ